MKNIEQLQNQNLGLKDKQTNLLAIKNIVLQNIENPEFRKRIFPLKNEKISEDTFEKALNRLLNAEISVSREDKIKLFQQTLEYYSSPIQVEKPLWHSTNSYSLRKSLEEGLGGGHGEYSGEAVVTSKESGMVQESLSVSNPVYPSAETFQQMFARLNAKKELSNFLIIDSEKLTGRTIPEVFSEEFINTTSKEEKKEGLATKFEIPIEDINEEMIKKEFGEEAQKAFIDDFNKRDYSPDIELIRKKVLPNILDDKLKKELEYEAEHPFPCMITIESLGKEKDLSTVSDGKKPTHIPFVDAYWSIFKGEDIREIRVPENQIVKVQEWLKEKGLKRIKIVPIEIFEIKRMIQDSI